MKNKRLQRYVKSAKAEVRRRMNNNLWDPVRNIKVYHCYDEPRELSYWDDVTFKLGSQLVFVCWTHPRYEFYEEVDHEAYDYANKMFPSRNVDDMFKNDTPNYVKRGKSRKGILSYTCNFESPEGFYDAWKEKREELSKTTDRRTGTKFEVKQVSYGRLVSICCPIEVRNEDDLVVLADLVRDVLTGKVNFNEKFAGYSYGADDYAKEKPETFTDQKVA